MPDPAALQTDPEPHDQTAVPDPAALFALFTEIAILEQLSRALLEQRLPRGFLASHFGVLNHLIRTGDGQTPLALARAFQVPKTSMTHTLAGLESAGLVRLARNPADGRSKCTWLTPAGRGFHADALAAVTPDIARLSASLPAAQAQALVGPLQALRRAMDADRSATGGGRAAVSARR